MISDLLIREAVLLVVCASFGVGVVAFLKPGDRVGQPLALVPSAGLAVGAGLLMTINLIVPLRHAFWFVVVPVALFSAAITWRVRMRMARPAMAELARMALVVAVALGSGSYVLVERDTLGPIGYGIFDGPGYISFAQGFESATNEEPLLRAGFSDWPEAKYDGKAWGASWNLSQRYGWGYRWQHTGSISVASVAAGVGGWAPWTMIGALLAVFMACGALAVYALTGYLGAGGFGRTLAAVTYCGPLLYTVVADGSVALAAGLAIVPTVLIFAITAFERPSARTAALAGATVGGLQTAYPEIAPAVVGGLVVAAAAATLVLPAVRHRRVGPELRVILSVVPIAIGAGLLVGLRSVPWTWEYLVGGRYRSFASTLIQYNMDLKYLPGWLFQTRDFYSFAFAAPSGLLQGLIGVALPVVLVGICVAAFVWAPRARWLIGIVAVVLLQAFWVSSKLDCSYCAQRSLLVLSPVLPALLVAGAAMLLRRYGQRGRDAVIAISAVAVVAVASTALAAQQRVREGAVIAPTALSGLDAMLERVDRPLLLEGYSSVPYASWLLNPTTYSAATQATTQRLSVVADYNEFGAFSYMGSRPFPHPSWTPGYGYVLTRLGRVEQPGRGNVVGAAPYLLQRRARPFDVTIAGGVASDSIDRDPGGAAWVQAPTVQAGLQVQPLEFRIAAERPGPAFLRLRLLGPPGLAVQGKGFRVQTTSGDDGALDVCARVDGGATRRAGFDVTPTPPGFGPPLRKYENTPQPAKTTQLVRMDASARPCSSTGST